MANEMVDLTIRVRSSAKKDVVDRARRLAVSQGAVLRAMLSVASQHDDEVDARIIKIRDRED